MTMKVVLVGCGNMGYAMLAGWLKSGQLSPSETFVAEPNADLRARAEKLAKEMGLTLSKALLSVLEKHLPKAEGEE